MPRSDAGGRTRARNIHHELGREGVVIMLQDHETHGRAGANGSHREETGSLSHQPTTTRTDVGCDPSDALMHLSDVVMREMFAVSMRLNEDFTRVVGDPAAGSAHLLIARLDQRIKEIRRLRSDQAA